MADDNALGFSRGPRGIGQQGGIVRPSTFYVFFKSGGFLGVDLTPCRAHTFKRMQKGTYTPAELPIANLIGNMAFYNTDPMVMAFASTEFGLTYPAALAEWAGNGVVFGAWIKFE